ncbi:sugar nucleotide-binding protein [Roseateles sp. UC29_93]|uniref:sugar nucleotide-binding protein n=1 Tax=Roseateles sp. UC29_93 TaxID=3350177 RepID=UPI003672680E
MKLLITGLNGTVAPWVGREAETRGWDVVGWDRGAVDPADEAAALAFLRAEAPDAIVHLAMGAESWAAQLAGFARLHGVPLVFVSTAMVFDASSGGPHRPRDQRTAKDDYGQYKDSMRGRGADGLSVGDRGPHRLADRAGWCRQQHAPSPG